MFSVNYMKLSFHKNGQIIRILLLPNLRTRGAYLFFIYFIFFPPRQNCLGRYVRTNENNANELLT